MALTGAIFVLAGPALAEPKETKKGAQDPFQRCAQIKNSEARLACFDAVTMALRQAGATVPARSAPTPQPDPTVAAREAEIQRREAELARRQAELAAQQAEREADERAAELARREAELAAEEARIAAERQAAAEARREAELAAQRARLEAEAEARRLETDPAAEDPAPSVPETTPAKPGEEFGEEDVIRRERKKGNLPEEKEVKEVTLKVTGFRYNNAGRAVVAVENGQIWRQKEGSKVFVGRDGPETVRIRKGWLGSYFLQFDGKGKSIRVERIK